MLWVSPRRHIAGIFRRRHSFMTEPDIPDMVPNSKTSTSPRIFSSISLLVAAPKTRCWSPITVIPARQTISLAPIDSAQDTIPRARS